MASTKKDYESNEDQSVNLISGGINLQHGRPSGRRLG